MKSASDGYTNAELGAWRDYVNKANRIDGAYHFAVNAINDDPSFDAVNYITNTANGGNTNSGYGPVTMSLGPGEYAYADTEGHGFASGTMIVMANGTTKPIEEIVVGDQVLAVSEDDPTGERIGCTVTYVHTNESEETQWNLTFETESGEVFSILSGENHLFYVDGQGWISANDLEEGAICIAANGKITTLLSKSLETTSQTLYTFTVEPHHTFFVGNSSEKAILVHNVAVGHHYLPRASLENVFNRLGQYISKDAVKVAAGYYSGPIGPHGWNTVHRVYNQAAETLFEDYLKQEIAAGNITKKNPLSKLGMHKFIENHLIPGVGLDGNPNNVIKNFNRTVIGNAKGNPRKTLEEAIQNSKSVMKTDPRYKAFALKFALSSIFLTAAIDQTVQSLEVTANSQYFKNAIAYLQNGDVDNALKELRGTQGGKQGDGLYDEILDKVSGFAALNADRFFVEIFDNDPWGDEAKLPKEFGGKRTWGEWFGGL